MGNLELKIFVLNKDNNNSKVLAFIEQIFDIDNDYSENEEYFRDDTIELGFSSESERCAKEVYEESKKYEDFTQKIYFIFDTVISYNNGKTTFIVGNDAFCNSYTYEITEMKDCFVVSLAYGLDE